MTFDELRERYLEDLATPEGGAATRLLESAIAHARGIPGPGFPPATRERLVVADPVATFSEEIDRLLEWSTTHDIPVRDVGERFGSHDTQGTEHWVWFEETRVRKISFSSLEFNDQGPYGQTVQAFADTDLEENRVVVIENRKASPSEYLERLYLQNILFQVDNRLEAVHSSGLESTQPLFVGEVVSQQELEETLGLYGFSRQGSLTWYSAPLAVAISDVALHNVIKANGVIFPFDIWARRIAI